MVCTDPILDHLLKIKGMKKIAILLFALLALNGVNAQIIMNGVVAKSFPFMSSYSYQCVITAISMAVSQIGRAHV